MTKEPEFYICDICDVMKNYSRYTPHGGSTSEGNRVLICPQCKEKIDGDTI
jgi:hypothetical protein